MKNHVAVFAALFVSQVVYAQGAQSQQPEDLTLQAQPALQDQSAPDSPGQVSSGAGNPIYILNNQRLQGYQGTNQQAHQGQALVQEQPISVVQDSPLRASPADILRKRRQESETATEDGIVQQLERTRIEDEMRRRDRFNNAIAPVAAESSSTTIAGNGNTVQQTNLIAQQPVQTVVPAPVAVQPVPTKKVVRIIEEREEVADDEGEDYTVKAKKNDVDIRSEIRAALEESKPKDEEKTTSYVAGLASFGEYDQVVNINRSMGWGFAVGMNTPERLQVEGSFLFGDYELEDIYSGYFYGFPMIVDMRQYNVGAAVKYSILPGRFRPLAGALLSYTRRSYTAPGGFEFSTSDAIDVGALFGADLVVSDTFTVGVDFRYMTNMGYRQNSNQTQSFVYANRRNDPERLDYYTLNLLGKFTF